jgi:hypothetical protein
MAEPKKKTTKPKKIETIENQIVTENIIFEPNLVDLKPEIQDLISVPISYWLPYINIDSIDITTNEDDPNMNHDVKISITYAVDNFAANTITVLASQSNVTVE